MTDIKITGYNDKKSKPDSNSFTVVFNLSEVPTKEWQEVFLAARVQAKDVQINDIRFGQHPAGKEVAVETPKTVAMQTIVDQLEIFVDAANNSEESFREQLKSLKFKGAA